MGKTTRQISKEINRKLKHYKPTRCNRHLQNTPPNDIRTYVLLKCTWTFSRIDRKLDHKTSLNKSKRIETIPSIFSDQNGLQLETINRRKSEEFTNTWKLNNTLISNHRVKENVTRVTIKYLAMNGKENTTYETSWDAAKAVFIQKHIAVNSYI